MFNRKKIILFLILTLFFTGVIFLINTFFYNNEIIEKNEQKFIDKTIKQEKDYLKIAKEIVLKEKKKDNIGIKKQVNIEIKKEKIKQIKKIIEKKNKIKYIFIPKNYYPDKDNIKTTINSNIFFNFIDNIKLVFVKERPEVRGKMKDRSIFLFNAGKMQKDELIAVFIHEFSHYIDLYFFSRDIYGNDISNKFYEISWKSSIIMKSGQKGNDFVSGYAMTNKYEDFAETSTYFILHNGDFLKKAKKSSILQKKYNFFNFYLFKNKYFKNTNFSTNTKIKNYYWDITKIKFSLKNFLQYIKK